MRTVRQLLEGKKPGVVTIDATEPVRTAIQLMADHYIGALPVLEGGKLAGIVSDRDVHLIETRPDSDPDEVTVEEAMTQDVYAVGLDEPVDAVAEQMAAHKYGCAIVVNRRGGIEGIFTTVDAMQVLADVLRKATA